MAGRGSCACAGRSRRDSEGCAVQETGDLRSGGWRGHETRAERRDWPRIAFLGTDGEVIRVVEDKFLHAASSSLIQLVVIGPDVLLDVLGDLLIREGIGERSGVGLELALDVDDGLPFDGLARG